MNIEEIRAAVRKTVSEGIDKVLTEATEQRLSIFEKSDEEDKDIGKKKKEDDESEDDESEDDESEDDESEDLKEALQVSAMSKSRGNKAKPEEFEVKDMRELTKLASTGKYDWFMVTKKNGDESEYIVEKGKLVVM